MSSMVKAKLDEALDGILDAQVALRAATQQTANEQPGDVDAELLKALKDAVDSLEYVERNHGGLPGLTGGAVRHERICAANKAIAKAEEMTK